MKTAPSSALLPAALLVASVALPATALAFAEIERGSLTITTIGRVAYNTNLMGNATDLDDTVFTLAPTLNYNRAAGLGTIDASFGIAANRYVDYTNLDNEDVSASLQIGLPTPEGARQQGGFNARYTDTTEVDETVATRVRAKTWSTGFSGTYRAGTRTDLRANLSYTDTARDVFSDRTSLSAGLGFDYSDFLGGFGLEGDYRYTDTQSSRLDNTADTSIDQTSHNVSTGLFYKFVSGLRASADVGYRWIDRGRNETADARTSDNSMTFALKLDGPFLPASRFPKLTSSFSLGLQKGQTLGLNDRGSTTLVGSLGLAWQARERTALTFNASRSQGLSSANLSTIDNVVSLGVTQRIGERTNLSGSIAQDWSSYSATGRSDRHTRGALNLGYSLNRNWQAGAGYALTLSRSNNDFIDYDRHIVNAFVSCTY